MHSFLDTAVKPRYDREEFKRNQQVRVVNYLIAGYQRLTLPVSMCTKLDFS